MTFYPHGDYTIEIRGNIIVLRFHGTWNKEGAEAFFEDYKKHIVDAGFTRFGVLSDMENLEGGTPESITYFQEISDWAMEHGQVARALLLNSRFKKFIIDLVDESRSRFPVKICDDEPSAFEWLLSFDLNDAS